jgi:hypothetical protein
MFGARFQTVQSSRPAVNLLVVAIGGRGINEPVKGSTALGAQV